VSEFWITIPFSRVRNLSRLVSECEDLGIVHDINTTTLSTTGRRVFFAGSKDNGILMCGVDSGYSLDIKVKTQREFLSMLKLYML